MVMDDLYGQRCSHCHGHPIFTNQAAAVAFEFTEDLMTRILRDIFYKTFNVEEEIDEDLFLATIRTFNRATDEGFGIRDSRDPEP